ncbi:MAG: tetratricopeptide repeat protein [Terriglobia bacterium]
MRTESFVKKNFSSLCSKRVSSVLFIGSLLQLHLLFFGVWGQETPSSQEHYSFRVRVLVAEKTSDIEIKVKVTRPNGELVGERELAYQGTAIFDQLTAGQYLVTIERANQPTIARPLEFRDSSVKNISWDIRISGDATTVRESNKDNFQKASGEISSVVSKKALKAFQEAAEESARGNLLKAIELLQKAIKEAPNFLEAYNNLGAQYQKLREWNQAIEAYQHAIAIKGDNPMPYVNLGTIYLEKGETDSALKSFQKALDLDDSNIRAHLALSRIYIERRDYERAEVHLEAVTRMDPSHNRQAFVALIQMETMAQRYERAQFFLANFQKYFPADPEIEKLKQVIASHVSQ